MPEGRCRRPHRKHEAVYLFAKDEQHQFRKKPPVESVWHLANDKVNGKSHYSRFPIALPYNCIEAYQEECNKDVVVLDPFSGSGTTGIASIKKNCSYIGFEIDKRHVKASNIRLKEEMSKLFYNP